MNHIHRIGLAVAAAMASLTVMAAVAIQGYTSAPLPAQAAAAQQAVGDGEREARIDVEDAHPDEGLDLEEAQMRRTRQAVGEFGIRDRGQFGHFQPELHAQKQGEPRAEITNEVLVKQAQAAQLHFGKENGVAEVVSLDLLRRLQVDAPAVGPDQLLPSALPLFDGLSQQFVDLGLVEKLTCGFGGLVRHAEAGAESGHWMTKSEKYTWSATRWPSAWL